MAKSKLKLSTIYYNLLTAGKLRPVSYSTVIKRLRQIEGTSGPLRRGRNWDWKVSDEISEFVENLLIDNFGRHSEEFRKES